MPVRHGPAGTLCLAAFLALGLSAPASAQSSDLIVRYNAQDGSVTRSIPVQIADLNLETMAGRARLDRRITVAARQACGYHGMYGLRQPADYQRCFDKARGDAMSEGRVVQTASRD